MKTPGPLLALTASVAVAVIGMVRIFQGLFGGRLWDSALDAAMLFAIAGLLAITAAVLHWRLMFPGENPSGDTTASPGVHGMALLLYAGVPLGHLVGPMLYMHWDKQAAERQKTYAELVNFQLTVTLLGCAALLMAVFGIGWIFLGLLAIYHLVITLRSIIRSSTGTPAGYPQLLRFVR